METIKRVVPGTCTKQYLSKYCYYIRVCAGITVEEFAELLGVSRSTAIQIDNGKMKLRNLHYFALESLMFTLKNSTAFYTFTDISKTEEELDALAADMQKELDKLGHRAGRGKRKEIAMQVLNDYIEKNTNESA